MVVTEKGNVVSGSYNWNDSSGHLSGTTSGVTWSGAFHETHYQGSFELKLEGTSYSGSYSGINRDTNGDISGSFSGKCLAGDCLKNGQVADAAELKAENDILSAIAGGSDYLSPNHVDNFIDVNNYEDELVSEFKGASGTVKTTLEVDGKQVDLQDVIRAAARAAASQDEHENSLSPTSVGVLPVIVAMAVHARDEKDPALAQSYAIAAMRLLQITTAIDAPKEASHI